MQYAVKKIIGKYLRFMFFTGCFCAVLSGCGQRTAEDGYTPEPTAPYDSEDNFGEITLPPAEVIYEDADITVPAGLVGNEISDDHIIDINESTASITYSLTGNERGDIIRQLSEDVTESISVILADKEHYPNITDITPNADYTEFTITLSGESINTYESMLTMSFYIVGNKYQIYNGISADETVTVVRYIDSVTGSVINETDSSLMQNTLQ